jgi:hypothetical protein
MRETRSGHGEDLSAVIFAFGLGRAFPLEILLRCQKCTRNRRHYLYSTGQPSKIEDTRPGRMQVNNSAPQREEAGVPEEAMVGA